MRIPQHAVQEADTCDAVDHGVMKPGRDRFAAVGEWTDDVERPQRPCPIEVLGHQLADGLP